MSTLAVMDESEEAGSEDEISYANVRDHGVIIYGTGEDRPQDSRQPRFHPGLDGSAHTQAGNQDESEYTANMRKRSPSLQTRRILIEAERLCRDLPLNGIGKDCKSRALAEEFFAKLPDRGWSHTFSEQDKSHVRPMLVEMQRYLRRQRNGDQKKAFLNKTKTPRLARIGALPSTKKEAKQARVEMKREKKREMKREMKAEMKQNKRMLRDDGRDPHMVTPNGALKSALQRSSLNSVIGTRKTHNLAWKTQRNASLRLKTATPSESFNFNNYQPLPAMTDEERKAQCEMAGTVAAFDNILSMEESTKSQREGLFAKYREVEMADKEDDADDSDDDTDSDEDMDDE